MKGFDCRSNSELMSREQDRNLSLGERLALRAHLMICPRCRRFRQQLDFIRRACRGLAERLPDER